MSKSLPAGRSWPSLPDLDLIASQTRLIIRKSCKLTAAAFLQSLLRSVATGFASLNQIAGDLKDRNLPGTARQSLHQRFDIRSTAFLMAVLYDLMQQRFSTIASAVGSRTIQRILIEDASGQVMPESNADAFPAHGNDYGKTAGVKIDFAFDLLTGSIVSLSLQAATEQDKSIGKEFVIEVRCGDLVLRDMGNFSLNEFTEIEQRKAWWLTRLPLTTGFLLADGHTLEKYLKSCCKDIIDLDVIVGEQGKHCRLVAMRAAPEITAARRAERRKKAQESGKQPCPKGLHRDGWALEIQFRAWKQALNLGKALNRKSNEHHLQALVLAGMIAHQLGMRIAQRIVGIVSRERLSYEKF